MSKPILFTTITRANYDKLSDADKAKKNYQIKEPDGSITKHIGNLEGGTGGGGGTATKWYTVTFSDVTGAHNCGLMTDGFINWDGSYLGGEYASIGSTNGTDMDIIVGKIYNETDLKIGNKVRGVDYTCRVATTEDYMLHQSIFPQNWNPTKYATVIEWISDPPELGTGIYGKGIASEECPTFFIYEGSEYNTPSKHKDVIDIQTFVDDITSGKYNIMLRGGYSDLVYDYNVFMMSQQSGDTIEIFDIREDETTHETILSYELTKIQDLSTPLYVYNFGDRVSSDDYEITLVDGNDPTTAIITFKKDSVPAVGSQIVIITGIPFFDAGTFKLSFNGFSAVVSSEIASSSLNQEADYFARIMEPDYYGKVFVMEIPNLLVSMDGIAGWIQNETNSHGGNDFKPEPLDFFTVFAGLEPKNIPE